MRLYGELRGEEAPLLLWLPPEQSASLPLTPYSRLLLLPADSDQVQRLQKELTPIMLRRQKEVRRCFSPRCDPRCCH